MTTELDLTQYFLGAVIFILKQTVESVGLINLKLNFIIVVNGPLNLSSYRGSVIKTCS